MAKDKNIHCRYIASHGSSKLLFQCLPCRAVFLFLLLLFFHYKNVHIPTETHLDLSKIISSFPKSSSSLPHYLHGIGLQNKEDTQDNSEINNSSGAGSNDDNKDEIEPPIAERVSTQY